MATVSVFGVRGVNEPAAPLPAFAQPSAASASAATCSRGDQAPRRSRVAARIGEASAL